MSIRDKIDDLYRDYQLDNGDIPKHLIINHFEFLGLKDELGLSWIEDMDAYHGMSIEVTEEGKTRLENYASFRSEDDFYFDE